MLRIPSILAVLWGVRTAVLKASVYSIATYLVPIAHFATRGQCMQAVIM